MTVILERLTGAFALNCELFFLTLLFSLPLGLVVAFGSMSRCAPLRGVVKTFVWVIRGTPLMLQIIVIYLGPGLLGMSNPWPSGSGGRMVAAVVAFAINYACYFSEIYRGGIEAVPKGQTEAGEVLGMTKTQIFFKVTLPLLMPILVYTVITALIGGLQMFDVPQVLTNGLGTPNRSATTLVMYLNNYLKTSKNYGMAGAISVVIFIITGLLSMVVFKSLTKQDEE